MIEEVAQHPAVGARRSAEIVDLQSYFCVSNIIENLPVAVTALIVYKRCVSTLVQVDEQIRQTNQIVLWSGAEELKLGGRCEDHVAAEVLLVTSRPQGAIFFFEPLGKAKIDQSQFILAGL